MSRVITDPSWVVDEPSTTRDGILERLSGLMAPRVGEPPGRLLQAVLQRERLCPTVVDDLLALPHARLPQLQAFYVGLARVRGGVEFAPGKLVRIVCMLLGPDGRQEEYLETLAALLRLFAHRGSKLLRARPEQAAAMLSLGKE